MPRRSLLTFAALLATAAHCRAVELPIVNPSFELTSRPLAVGEQSNGAGGLGTPVATRFPFMGGSASWANPIEVPGWRTFTRPVGDTAIVYAGVLNPPLRNNQPFISNPHGQNVAALQIGAMGQTLRFLIQPSTRYRLDFLGGIGLFDSNYFLSTSLIAVDDLVRLPLINQPGVQRLAQVQDAVPPQSSFGTLLPYSIEYTTPDVLPANLVGRYIGIHMFGSDGIPRVVYDDFRLDASPVPGSSTCISLSVLVLTAHRRRRRTTFRARLHIGNLQ